MQPILSSFSALILGSGLILAALPLSAQQQENAAVTFRSLPEQHKVLVNIDGKPFTAYCYPDTLEKPILYPLRTASGHIITRGFPLEPRPGERTDHPHHVGM